MSSGNKKRRGIIGRFDYENQDLLDSSGTKTSNLDDYEFICQTLDWQLSKQKDCTATVKKLLGMYEDHESLDALRQSVGLSERILTLCVNIVIQSGKQNGGTLVGTSDSWRLAIQAIEPVISTSNINSIEDVCKEEASTSQTDAMIPVETNLCLVVGLGYMLKLLREEKLWTVNSTQLENETSTPATSPVSNLKKRRTKQLQQTTSPTQPEEDKDDTQAPHADFKHLLIACFLTYSVVNRLVSIASEKFRADTSPTTTAGKKQADEKKKVKQLSMNCGSAVIDFLCGSEDQMLQDLQKSIKHRGRQCEELLGILWLCIMGSVCRLLPNLRTAEENEMQEDLPIVKTIRNSLESVWNIVSCELEACQQGRGSLSVLGKAGLSVFVGITDKLPCPMTEIEADCPLWKVQGDIKVKLVDFLVKGKEDSMAAAVQVLAILGNIAESNKQFAGSLSKLTISVNLNSIFPFAESLNPHEESPSTRNSVTTSKLISVLVTTFLVVHQHFSAQRDTLADSIGDAIVAVEEGKTVESQQLESTPAAIMEEHFVLVSLSSLLASLAAHDSSSSKEVIESAGPPGINHMKESLKLFLMFQDRTRSLTYASLVMLHRHITTLQKLYIKSQKD